MGRKLIITEKPSVARDFAKVLKVMERGDGYIHNHEYVITWCVGHLVEMLYPEAYDPKYAKWALNDLPFLPKDYKYGVIKNVQKQYDIVHGFLQSDDIDVVYWAGDSGKEGQTIEENIRNYGGVREGMKELRVWIDSQTDEEILRGINEAKPMSDYAKLGESGIMRSIEDYALGINFSRALSVKYGRLINDAAATSSYTAIAVGRVMTCVLGMIVIREREIRSFTETPFYRVIGSFGEENILGEWKTTPKSKYLDSPLLYKENGFKKLEDANFLIQSFQGKEAIISSLEKNDSKKRAPLLFNLAELQAECSKIFKISPDETLQVAQDLYEKKLTTYPRTDARVLTTAVAKEIGKNIRKLTDYQPTKRFVEDILNRRSFLGIEKTFYTDDSKVTDHYAIIPTGQTNELKGMDELHVRVYELILKRFLSIFYPAAEYTTVKAVIEIENESLFASGKVLTKPGYMEITGLPKNNEAVNNENELNEAAQGQVMLGFAQKYKVGDVISANSFDVKEGKTSPPKRYTSGTMVLAMENAGNLIEDEELRAQIKNTGIGTSATRAEIIKKLINNKYIHLNQKTQVLSPEMLGEMIFEVVDLTIPSLLNPKMTASWEKGLEGITNGTVDVVSYRNKLEEYIRNETLSMVQNDLMEKIALNIHQFTGKDSRGMATRKKLGLICPSCGGELTTTSFGYGCSNYSNKEINCRFNVGSIAGVDLSEDMFRQLITEGHTPVIDGFVSGNKNKFKAALELYKDEEGKTNVRFDFSKNEPDIIDGLMCPVCKAPMEIMPYGYSCSNHTKDPNLCYFSIGKIAERNLSLEELTDLVQKGKTNVLSGFVSKKKKKFQAALELKNGEDGRLSLSFDFSEAQPQVVEGVVCPDCGKEILIKSFGYGCSGYNQDTKEGCKFAIGKIANKELNVSQVKELLSTGKTSTIRGFKSQKGTKFDACLFLEKQEDGTHRVKFNFEDVEAKVVKNVVCPCCGSEVIKTRFGYACKNLNRESEDGCKFSVGTMAGKELTENNIKELLTEGRTSTIYGFKSKSNKKFDARIALNKDENGIVVGCKFDFDDVEDKKIKDVKCPLCKNEVSITKFGYKCKNYSKEEGEGCKFIVGNIAGVHLSEAIMKQLLTTKKTDVISGFIAKTGMKFDAPLKLTEDGNVTFDFPEKPKPVETQLECPKCSKKLLRNQWSYDCECGFKLRHVVASVTLTEEIVRELLTEGKTKNKITGFVSKAGNAFDAGLELKEEGISFVFDDNAYQTSDNSANINVNGDDFFAEFGLVDETLALTEEKIIVEDEENGTGQNKGAL